MSSAAALWRADWRFLLPDPSPRRVACIGWPDPALVRALELTGASVDSHRPELVVIGGGRPAGVVAARDLLLEGGWVHAEVRGARVRAWERALRRAGFEEVQAYWLFPDAERCREIVPLERHALREALARRDPGARLRARARTAQLLARSGTFRVAVRQAAVIGRWRP